MTAMQSIKKKLIVFGVIYLIWVSKIAYLIVYLGENVISQFYWSQNLILFSFVIRHCKQWNKKVYLQLSVKNWISHLSQHTTLSEPVCMWSQGYTGTHALVFK